MKSGSNVWLVERRMTIKYVRQRYEQKSVLWRDFSSFFFCFQSLSLQNKWVFSLFSTFFLGNCNLKVKEKNELCEIETKESESIRIVCVQIN